MKIALIQARCKNLFCRHKFEAPLLPDMSYGLFIYFSSDGLNSKFYCCLNDHTWEFVSSIVDKECSVNELKKGTIIQKTIGIIADSTRPSINYDQTPVCPKCGNESKWNNRDNIISSTQIEELTFNEFAKLSDLDKKELVKSEIKKNFG